MAHEKQTPMVKEQDLSMAENLILTSKQVKFLLKRTPSEFIKTRPVGGGQTARFVSGGYVRKVLNLMFGWDWDFVIVNREIIWEAKQVVVEGRLKVRTGGREVVKTQFGRANIKFLTEVVKDENGKPVMGKNGKPLRQSTNETVDLGNDMKAAATDCMKKCASELGIAADVYSEAEFREVKVLSREEQEAIRERDAIMEEVVTCNTIEELDALAELYEKQELGMRIADLGAIIEAHRINLTSEGNG